jgi:putative CocE/NonD family hydrolase
VDPDDFSWESDWAKQEMLRWLERWLKGIENGVEMEPPIKIYVMNGEGVREEDEWPLARQVMTKLYFDEDGKLAAESAENGTDTYVTDYTHDSGFEEIDASFLELLGRPSVTDTFYTNRYTALAMFAPTQLAVRTEKDLKCLTYTSEPMTKDTEVTGHPIVHLWVSSTADHGDLFFYLEDVDESGEAVLITENLLRIGFAALVDDDEQINPNPGVDVLPDLPWHGFEDTDFVDGILAGGYIVEIVNDFHPTSWVFRQGHRIRISIACSDWPSFRLNPYLYAGAGDPTNDPGDYMAPTITVYRGDGHPSHIELPIIP